MCLASCHSSRGRNRLPALGQAEKNNAFLCCCIKIETLCLLFYLCMFITLLITVLKPGQFKSFLFKRILADLWTNFSLFNLEHLHSKWHNLAALTWSAARCSRCRRIQLKKRFYIYVKGIIHPVVVQVFVLFVCLFCPYGALEEVKHVRISTKNIRWWEMFAQCILSVILFIAHGEDHMVGWKICVTAPDK